MKLSSIRSSNPHTIVSVAESELQSRLYELGIFPKQTVQVRQQAPLGDPLMIEVDGHLIMLRLNEADLITVEETPLA